jgi:TIR domain/Pentapeptide repeats (8 copies)
VADEEAVERLRRGVAEWNVWLKATLIRAGLIRGLGANLRDANLTGVNLIGVNLANANLSGANLTSANLSGANLASTNLSGAELSGAYLVGTILRDANLSGANLTDVFLMETIFSDVDLTGVIGLERCTHLGASIIDHRTLQRSGTLPLAFLRGVGLPDNLIEYLPSLLNQAVQHYSCFISYSAKDQDFADRLYADLQNKGVRCWFAPHDLRIGKKILDEIDAAIRLRDRVLLILSEHAINSDWVEDEVTAGFEEERKRGEEVLFPVRLDDTVMTTNEAWASKLRARLIGDFTRWKDHDAYKQSFERVVRDLNRVQLAK